MISLLYNIPVFHNKDHIRITNRRQPVCKYETCSSFHQLIHRLLDLDLGSCIYRTCRLIKNQNLRICQHGSCDRKELFLSL